MLEARSAAPSGLQQAGPARRTDRTGADDGRPRCASWSASARFKAGAIPRSTVLRARTTSRRRDRAGPRAQDRVLSGKGLASTCAPAASTRAQQAIVIELNAGRRADRASPSTVRSASCLSPSGQRGRQRAGAQRRRSHRLRAGDQGADSFARDGIGIAAEISAGTTKYSGRVRSVAAEWSTARFQPPRVRRQKPDGLRQNQRLTARIVLDEKPNVLMVERGPFLEAGGGHCRVRVRDGVASDCPSAPGGQPGCGRILSGARPEIASWCPAPMPSATPARAHRRRLDSLNQSLLTALEAITKTELPPCSP